MLGGTSAVAVLGALYSQSNSLSGAFGYIIASLAALLTAIFYARNAFPRARAARFRATGTGISIEGHDELRSEDILEAKLVPRHSREAVVELALRGRKTLSIRTDFHDAKALVDLLGARRTRFRLVVPFAKRFVAVMALLASVSFLVTMADFGMWLSMLPGVLFWAAVLGWLVGYVRGRLVVGADGYTTRWLFRERFVPFREVVAVQGRARFLNASTDDTFVELASGRKVRLRTVEAPNTEEERGGESRAMLAHLAEAFTRSTRLQATVDVPALVARGSRTARDWLSGIDALVRGGGASRYRVAAVSPDMLVEVATDPSATVESRVGAAAALVRMGDDTFRTRVRVSAEACAEPELRAALLALSDAHDDAAAEAALASLRR